MAARWATYSTKSAAVLHRVGHMWGTGLTLQVEGIHNLRRMARRQGFVAHPPYRFNMTLTTLTRIVALLSALLVLGIGFATAGHLHDEDEAVRHDCALCTTGSLSLFIDAKPASSPSLTDALSYPLDPQGPPLYALYHAYPLSRAPPVLT